MNTIVYALLNAEKVLPVIESRIRWEKNIKKTKNHIPTTNDDKLAIHEISIDCLAVVLSITKIKYVSMAIVMITTYQKLYNETTT